MKLSERQLAMLRAMSARGGCMTIGPVDAIDPDYNSLLAADLVKEYWGSGLHSTLTPAGRALLEDGDNDHQ